ncbi:MAG TPA: OmpA family protein, partial [Bacteroidota bacterium]|nr:OmpA family protein [Bacteroidota bacterium]
MKIAAILAVVVALILGVTAWFFSQSASRLEKERDDMKNARDELQVRVNNLDQEKAALAHRLEEQIAGSSRAKEQEIDRLKATYDTLMASMKAEIDEGQVTITKLADRLSVSMVDRILFPSGESDITPAGLKVLQRVGDVLKNTENKVVRVEGHTDNVPISDRLAGKFPTNWELSTARASNVVRFLQEKVAIDPARLEAVGLSEYHPVAGNATEKGRAQNRRI